MQYDQKFFVLVKTSDEYLSILENTVDGSEIPNNHLGCMKKLV